jgi:hypothetical protein
MSAITKVDIQGAVQGLKTGNKIVDFVLDIGTDVTEYNTGAVVLPSGSSTTVTFDRISSAVILMIDSSVSVTVTMADSQKINLDGLGLMKLHDNKSVVSFTVVQTRGVTALVDWFAAQ